MVKQLSKYKIKMLKNIILIISLVSYSASAQIKNIIDYSNPKTYEIGGIMIDGAHNLNNSTLVTITGLSIGEEIKIPGDKITKAVTKLWEQGLFEDVNITIDKIIDNTAFLNIIVSENPRISKFKFKGKKIRKSDITSLKEDLKLMRGKVLTQNLINNSINTIKKYFINKGFYNINIEYLTSTDTTATNSKNLIFNINKGEKIKIKDIIIKGRNKILN